MKAFVEIACPEDLNMSLFDVRFGAVPLSNASAIRVISGTLVSVNLVLKIIGATIFRMSVLVRVQKWLRNSPQYCLSTDR